jgi:integrase
VLTHFIVAADVARSRDFYVGVLGGRVVLDGRAVEGLRVHDLRHTAGTLATAAGGSLREVMDRLGRSTTVAAVRYQHVMTERDAAITRQLNRLIEDS